MTTSGTAVLNACGKFYLELDKMRRSAMVGPATPMSQRSIFFDWRIYA
jgi:hypothetical protein